MKTCLDSETESVLDEVIRHSITRTGTVACAIEAGIVALGDGSALAGRHHQTLEEWVSMVSECGGVGDRWLRWRDAVATLLQALDAATPPGPFDRFLATLTQQQAAQVACSLSAQQRDLLQQALLREGDR